MIYNDASVLENYHIASAFRIFSITDCNILSTLTRDEWMDVRKIMISCILATDMSHHFEMVAQLDPLFDKIERMKEENRQHMTGGDQQDHVVSVTTDNSNPSSNDSAPAVTASPTPALTSAPPSATVPPTPSLELTRDDIIHLLNVLLHSADISNPGKPWKIAKSWGDRIQAENFAQGDLERKMNLPVSPFMDRQQENQAQASMNFIDFIVAPLQLAIVRAFPTLAPLADNLIKNRKMSAAEEA